MTDMQLALDVGQGNPGALNVVASLIGLGHKDVVEKLQEKGIKGADVWILFKDECGEDHEKLVQKVMKDD